MEFQEQLHFALAFTITIAKLVVTILVKGNKRQKRRPPEPDGALPFIGHLHLFGKNQLLHRIFADMADKHGPAFLIRLGVRRALVVNNWEVAKECFTTNDKVFSTRPKSIAVKYMGYDYKMLGFAPYGPYWRNMRSLAMVELLSIRRLELLKHVRDNEIGSFIKELYEQSVKNGGVALLEMKERIGDLATNIIVRMVAGKRYHGTSEESRRFQKALSDFFYLAGLFLASDTIPFLGWLDVVMGNIGKIKRTAKELDFAIGSWVNEHRERRLDKGIEGNQDFIDAMLSIMDENNVPIQEADVTIKANCLTLALGGIDTNVSTLSWAISLLLNNRHVLKKAQEELDIHVGKQRQVEESDIANLVYLQAIIKETLRLYPATPVSVAREAMDDCTVAGFHIPAGTQLLLNLWKLHRDPGIWHKPLDFLPERFLSDHANIDVRGQKFELIPFGAGRRICPGITFALHFQHLALARLLHGFEWGTVSDKSVDMSERPGIIVPKATPLEEQLLLALPFTIIITILGIIILVNGNKQQQRRPPEPVGALPFIGHLHLLGKSQLLHRKFEDMADEHGPAFVIRLGVHRALVVSNWEIAKECFTTNDKVFPTRPKSLAVKYMGYDHKMLGFAPYGPYWRSMRKLATVELLSSRRLELLKHVHDTEISSFIKELYEQSVKNGGSAVLEMKERIGDLATNIIVRMIAGKRYCGIKESCSEESRRWQKALGDFFYLTGLFLVSDAIPFLGCLDVVIGTIGKIKRTAKELDFVLGNWVNEHRERRLNKGIEGNQDFVDVMLSIMDENNVPTQEADVTIKATCLSLVLGGVDTNVVTLTWAISLLLNNRHVLKKAQEELDIHVGNQQQVEESDIANLVYLQAIIKETLRLYPATPILVPREAMEDCTVAGFHIPAGTRLLVNLWKLQRDPRIWHKPLDFLPERFLSDHANIDVRGQNFVLIPFGAGRRICPGITFALHFQHLTLARLLHGFKWGTVSDKAVDMSESPGMTVPKATPLQVTITPKLRSMLYR